jgi:hypothetical protein
MLASVIGRPRHGVGLRLAGGSSWGSRARIARPASASPCAAPTPAGGRLGIRRTNRARGFVARVGMHGSINPGRFAGGLVRHNMLGKWQGAAWRVIGF